MRNFDFKRYTPRPKELLRASLSGHLYQVVVATFYKVRSVFLFPLLLSTCHFVKGSGYTVYIKYSKYTLNIAILIIGSHNSPLSNLPTPLDKKALDAFMHG